MARATLNPNLREFWEKPARNRVLYGGRDSTKSWDAAGVALFAAQASPHKIMCVRQFQNKITDSVYTLLKNQIPRFKFDGLFDVQKSVIKGVNGSEFVFYGLWRHIDEIKSAEGVDILWIEEAHNLTKEQWDILEPTIRKEGSQIWIIFNPALITDFVYQRFVLNPPPNTVVRKINYDENPFLSEVSRGVIEARKAESYDDYLHTYRGEPRTDDDQVIIKRSWLLSCVDAAAKLGVPTTGRRRVGFDVADSGEDLNAEAVAHGVEIKTASTWKGGEDELPDSAERVYKTAIEHDADVRYDSIGVGAFVGGYIKKLNEANETDVSHVRFNAAAGVVDPDDRIDPDNERSDLNKDHYVNAKAQGWGDLAFRARLTHNAVTKGAAFDPDRIISFAPDCPHLDQIITELSSPRSKTAESGKMKVESKDDMKKRGLKSPNLADAVIAATAREEEVGYDWMAAL